MLLDATYHDAVDPTDTINAIDYGVDISDSLDFLAFDLLPQLITLAGAASAVVAAHGTHVAVVVAYVMLLYGISTKHSVGAIMPKLDKSQATGQAVQRRLENGLRGWKTAARHDKTEPETAAYAAENEKLARQHRELSLLRLFFD